MMQAPTTLTQGNGFNRLTAGAIGLALLAASAIGAVALNQQVDLPLIGSSSQAQTAPATDLRTETLFIEANSFDYQPVANYASAESIRFIEANVFDYATAPATTEQVRFHEENVWELQGHARTAGDAAASESAQDFRFLEENVWENQGQMIPPADTGNLDY